MITMRNTARGKRNEKWIFHKVIRIIIVVKLRFFWRYFNGL